MPGGFSYGDYLRAGAIARFSPVMESVIDVRRATAASCSGSATASRSLRGAPAAGRAAANANLRFICRQVELEVLNSGGRSRARARSGERLTIPAKHASGRYYADAETLAAMDAPARSCCATRRARTSTARWTTSPACATSAGNVFGLMPHPEHAVDALIGGSTDGLKIFESMRLTVEGALLMRVATADRVASTASDVEDALALGPHARGVRAGLREAGRRAPNEVELAMFSLLWSEHCAYKHSKKLLRTLPTEGAHVVMGPGENAGAVDVGGGLVCAFKVESHNHPSAVEPFQGAATGVGGILRDIFAIGARPIAVLDSLRFGEPSRRAGAGTRSRYLLDGAVAGIGHYGNSIGVPTVGGEVYFEGPYEQNCLVNAMALGLAERERLMRSAAAGPGNLLVLFGASTGRDGIGGASVLASAELGEAGDEDKRPTVQVGDPFEEKKLLECSLELLERGLLVALQDLGAAGLTSSAAEMASKGEVGIDIDVANVPLREPGMEPFEIMVSESQERMLCVVEPANVDAVLAVCEKWEVNGAAIGEVTDGGPDARASTAASSSATCRCRRSSTTARSMTSSRRSRASRSTRRRPRRSRPTATPREPLLALLRVPEHRLAPAAVRAVRRDRAVAHGAPPRAGRRRGAGARPPPRAGESPIPGSR